jgi:hypothetical protein
MGTRKGGAGGELVPTLEARGHDAVALKAVLGQLRSSQTNQTIIA